MFYNKVNVLVEKQNTGSNKEIFYQLRSSDKNLQHYEILDADAF